MKSPQILENFLNRFTYVAKLFFALSLGIGTAIILAVCLYFLLSKIIHTSDLQREGCQICKNLDQLRVELNTNSTQNMSMPTEKAFIKSFSEGLLSIYGRQFGKNSDPYRSIETQIHKLTNSWNPPFSPPFPWQQQLESAEIIKDIQASVVYDYNMNLGISIPIHQMSTLLTLHLPTIIDVITSNWAMFNRAHMLGTMDSETRIHIQANQQTLLRALTRLAEDTRRLIENENKADSEALEPFYLELQLFLKTVANQYKNWERIDLNSHRPNSNFDADDSLSKSSQEIIQEVYSSTIETLNSFQKTSTLGFETLTDLITKQKESLTLILSVAITAVTINFIACIIIWATRVVRKPLENLKKASDELSEGNLSVRVPITSNDEVANTSKQFNNMAKFFELIMIDASQIADELTKSTAHIFNTAKQLDEGVQKQEYAIHQIATSTKNISLTVKNFANYLKDVHKTALATTHFAETGRLSLLEMEAIMKQIVGSSNNIVNALSVLNQQGKEINNVITTIVKIADQSNLLSLNTAIRAGKTGLKGIGFAVVADKIRELADQTANATLDIEGVVGEIVQVVEDSVHEVESFSGRILQQVGDEKTISNRLKEVIEHTQQQIRIIDEVNVGMQEQAKRAQQIHDSLNNLMVGAQSSSQSVRKLYQEIENLYNITTNLQTLIGKFSVHSLAKKSEA